MLDWFEERDTEESYEPGRLSANQPQRNRVGTAGPQRHHRVPTSLISPTCTRNRACSPTTRALSLPEAASPISPSSMVRRAFSCTAVTRLSSSPSIRASWRSATCCSTASCPARMSWPRLKRRFAGTPCSTRACSISSMASATTPTRWPSSRLSWARCPRTTTARWMHPEQACTARFSRIGSSRSCRPLPRRPTS